MRRKIAALLGVAAIAGAVLPLAACTGSDAVSTGTGDYRFVTGNGLGTVIPEAKRHKAGEVTGSLLDGGTFNLASDLGKVTVVNFWATWCSPCVVETPQFDSVYREYKNKGVTFVGIDTKEADRSAPRSFVKDNKISYPIVFDENGETAVELGNIPAGGLPFTVLIDKQGRVAAVYLRSMAPNDLKPVLKQLTAET
jgi:thiol-disulfide isomerase/thioredoxin